MLIKSFGANENERQALFIKMHDWERLKLTRQTLAGFERLNLNIKGSVSVSVTCL